MSFRRQLVAQFKKPSGLLGRLAGLIMTLRPSNRKRIRWTLDLIQPAKDARLLEIGFGPGLGIKWATKRARKGHVFGVDHSETMLAVASKRNRRALAQGRATLIAGTEANVPDEAQALDAIFSCNVVQFLADAETTFRDLKPRLKPGGRMVMTFMPRSKNPTREDAEAMALKVEGWMRSAGLDEVRTEWLELEPVPAIATLGTKPR